MALSLVFLLSSFILSLTHSVQSFVWFDTPLALRSLLYLNDTEKKTPNSLANTKQNTKKKKRKPIVLCEFGGRRFDFCDIHTIDYRNGQCKVRLFHCPRELLNHDLPIMFQMTRHSASFDLLCEHECVCAFYWSIVYLYLIDEFFLSFVCFMFLFRDEISNILRSKSEVKKREKNTIQKNKGREMVKLNCFYF